MHILERDIIKRARPKSRIKEAYVNSDNIKETV